MGEFVVWLRRIVVNNILRVVEQHVLAEKRRRAAGSVARRDWAKRLEKSTVRLETFLAEQAESPSGCAVRREDEILLADTLATMPADYRDVIVLRHIEGLPFEEVAMRMDRSAGAVRMLWLRRAEEDARHLE